MDKYKRCVGEFKCPKCRRRWKSTNCWPGYGQECQKCKINVMPYETRPIRSGENVIDPSLEHPQELCQKCRALGHPCTDIPPP